MTSVFCFKDLIQKYGPDSAVSVTTVTKAMQAKRLVEKSPELAEGD